MKHFKRNQIVCHITFTHYHRSLFCIFGENEMKNAATQFRFNSNRCVFLMILFLTSYLLQLPMLYTRTLKKKNNLNFIIQHYHVIDSTVTACCGKWDYAKRTLLKWISADINWHIVCCNVVKTSLNLMNLEIMVTKITDVFKKRNTTDWVNLSVEGLFLNNVLESSAVLVP